MTPSIGFTIPNSINKFCAIGGGISEGFAPPVGEKILWIYPDGSPSAWREFDGNAFDFLTATIVGCQGIAASGSIDTFVCGRYTKEFVSSPRSGPLG